MYIPFLGKYSKLSLQEEEQCDDLLLFLKLLSHLTSKDFLNFGPVEEQTDPLLSAVKPVDVVVSGMNIVLPLMSEETLKVGGGYEALLLGYTVEPLTLQEEGSLKDIP